MKKTQIIIFSNHSVEINDFLNSLHTLEFVADITLVSGTTNCSVLPNTQVISTSKPFSFGTFQQIFKKSSSEYFTFIFHPELTGLSLALKRMMQNLEETGKAMAYADYLVKTAEGFSKHPLANFQNGSLRDDFDLGSIQMYRSELIPEFLKSFEDNQFEHAAHYALNLLALRSGGISHIPEPLYVSESEYVSGGSHFGYLEADKRILQVEMEKICTQHLETIGAKVSPPFQTVSFSHTTENKASVIIPVRNREKTILDAVQSALSQKTNFDFNVIVVDNHSTDGTSSILRKNINDDRLVLVLPEAFHLGIGGCWDLAIQHPQCGTFAVQLDSDDLYIDENTLQKVVDTFETEQCAMVIGAYNLVDFDLNPIPPGLIDHREWTDDNGANNALRINGFGAPRAFYRDLVRQIGFPNVSYGEDYAVALRLASEYKVGRIYDPLYLCRRWSDNTDAQLSLEQKNAFNTYKDWIRTQEIERRIKNITPSN